MSEVQVLPQGLRKLAQEFARIDARSFDRPRFEMLIRDAAELQHEMEAFAATGASLSAQAPFSSFQRALGLVTSISGLLAAMLRGDYGPLDEAIVQSRSGPLREKAFAGLPVAPEPHRAAEGRNTIFIAHGRKQIYQSLVLHQEEEWDTDVEYFEHEDRTSDQITAVLDRMMEGAGAALIVMTAEDQTIDGTFRTRQNVVHEAGLFQGRLRFARVALLRPHHVEKFSNVDGLLYITLDEDHIEHSFTQIDRFLKKLSFARRQ